MDPDEAKDSERDERHKRITKSANETIAKADATADFTRAPAAGRVKCINCGGVGAITDARTLKRMVCTKCLGLGTVQDPLIGHVPPLTKEELVPMDRWRSSSGATSSELRPAYADIPVSFLRRLARRFTLGASSHGRGNWLRSISFTTATGPAPRYDIGFLRDRYNHAVDHLLALRDGTATDDHIGAVGWFLAFADEMETKGVDWRQVLVVRTPEDDTLFHQEYGLIPIHQWEPDFNEGEPSRDSKICGICGREDGLFHSGVPHA